MVRLVCLCHPHSLPPWLLYSVTLATPSRPLQPRSSLAHATLTSVKATPLTGHLPPIFPSISTSDTPFCVLTGLCCLLVFAVFYYIRILLHHSHCCSHVFMRVVAAPMDPTLPEKVASLFPRVPRLLDYLFVCISLLLPLSIALILGFSCTFDLTRGYNCTGASFSVPFGNSPRYVSCCRGVSLGQ
ncbi:hypothetical protein BD414DRAFT_481350 [Trametes punicea]|nr:hypothetical protein BD414DRAFT_481350 [Trametes punicea]